MSPYRVIHTLMRWQNLDDDDDAVAPVAKPEPLLATEAPKVEAPKVEAPKVEAPKVEAPKVEAPKVEEPKVKIKVDVKPPVVPRAEGSERALSAPSRAKSARPRSGGGGLCVRG